HGPIWDLCAAIARGPAHEDMDIRSRKQLIGFALSHCDEESIMELLHAWKDLDMQGQCESLFNLYGTNSFDGVPEAAEISSGDPESHLRNTRNTLLLVAKHCLAEEAADLESFLKDNGRLFSFAASQLPWLLELSVNAEYRKNKTSGFATGKEFMSIRTQALVTILSWFSPRDSITYRSISDEINKMDKVQSTFWREWKLKLEEKKRVAERSRVLEQVIPGVDTARFLSGDLTYIRDAVFAVIESARLEKKHVIKDALKLADTYGLNHVEPVPEGMIVYQDVYKHYVHSLFTALESRAKTEFTVRNAEKFQEFIGQLEQTYDYCGKFIEHLATSDAMDVLKRCLTMILLLPGAYESMHDDSMWQDSLIFLVNFWFRLTEEMHKLMSSESSVGIMSFDPVSLSNCVRLFVTLVREDIVSPSQAWGTIVSYVNHGLIGDCAVEAAAFCRAMIFSGCSFSAVSEMISQDFDGSTAETRDLVHLYGNMLDPILRDLVNGTLDLKDLYHLLSSLGKMEGKVDLLQQVRRVVWERMAQFCDDLQLPNNIRVYALEIMQFIAGGNTKGFSSELLSNVLPWEGWHELLTSSKNESTGNLGLPDHQDNSSRLTSTLVALKSSQLVSAISPGMEISPDDLSDTETATSCFLKLCEVSSTYHHVEVLQAVLEEWERLFATVSKPVNTAEDAEVDNNNNWSNDDWDEGWESFQETEEKQNVVVGPNLHPLHACWIELFRKMVKLSQPDN
ncbi:MAG2-interacting protein 2, partial [Linum grandiflorum]